MTRVCAVCCEDIPDSDVEMLDHYTQLHPESGVFESALEELGVTAECTQCGEEFTSSAIHDDPGLMIQAYCDECQERNPVRGLSVETVSPSELVERRA